MNDKMILTWVMLVINVVGIIGFVVDFAHELKKKSMVKHVLKLQINDKNYLALDVVGFVSHLAILIYIAVELITQTNIQWLAVACLILYTPIFVVITIRPAVYNKVQEEQERLLRELSELNDDELMTHLKFTEEELVEMKEFYKAIRIKPDKEN